MTVHYDRTDVTWKPAQQVRHGDTIHGINMNCTQQFIVHGVIPNLSTFKVSLELRHALVGTKSTSTVWMNTAVAYPKD